MNGLHRQNELKLDILHSLARSQRALAEMVETIAPVMTASLQSANSSLRAASSDQVTKQILTHIESLSRYQHALAQKLSGIDVRQVKLGRPGKPYLAPTPPELRAVKLL
ncbi:hypothetical protein EHS13_08575 [Paenibacillus psychroresistens]|uniref:Uncharacterized protein n=1 Tax=Paenibacillus psychroresistens TaxID=1778678 RepID=A0A6B8RFN4_9BACL|nr:hypothetical protein [Paenibacillus psychroresistens]QGQ94929.1 hypothetical protein EHS13_08575 [Paenibacillus psychroresistens]